MKPNELIDNMVEKSKAEVKPTIPQKPAAPKPKAFTDYKGVEKTPYGHVYNFNGESITDLGAERASMKMPVEKGKNYGFTYTKGGDEVYADTFEDAYKALAYPSPKKNMIHTPESAKARINELQTYMDSLGENDSVDLDFANELDTLKKLQAISHPAAEAKEAEDYYKKAGEPFLKEVGDAYHARDPKQRWTPRDELTELAHYYRRHPKPVFEKVPELTREEKIANLKERFKNEPEKLRLIDDLLPMMEELFK